MNKAGKLAVLNSKVLDDQDVKSLTYKELEDILQFIDDNVVPYINDKSTAGQDLLNLFFTTFNKYVGKSDKNQAFTPDHICDFMSKAIGVNKKITSFRSLLWKWCFSCSSNDRCNGRL